MRDNLRQVTLEEFKDFRSCYSRELIGAIHRAYEPAFGTLNDESLGEWPNSIVAAEQYDEPIRYFILK